MHPIDLQQWRREKARDEIFRADYIESATRRQQEIKFWQSVLDATSTEWFEHDGSPTCPVLPGTRILLRLAAPLSDAKLASSVPEALNWSKVKSWKLHT